MFVTELNQFAKSPLYMSLWCSKWRLVLTVKKLKLYISESTKNNRATMFFSLRQCSKHQNTTSYKYLSFVFSFAEGKGVVEESAGTVC